MAFYVDYRKDMSSEKFTEYAKNIVDYAISKNHRALLGISGTEADLLEFNNFNITVSNDMLHILHDNTYPGAGLDGHVVASGFMYEVNIPIKSTISDGQPYLAYYDVQILKFDSKHECIGYSNFDYRKEEVSKLLDDMLMSVYEESKVNEFLDKPVYVRTYISDIEIAHPEVVDLLHEYENRKEPSIGMKADILSRLDAYGISGYVADMYVNEFDDQTKKQIEHEITVKEGMTKYVSPSMITAATLLSPEDYKFGKNREIIRNVDDDWWLRESDLDGVDAMVAFSHGSAYGDCGGVTREYGVRPVLELSAVLTDIHSGDRFEFGEHTYTVLQGHSAGNMIALCDDIIAHKAFRLDGNAFAVGDYGVSDVKVFLDEWFMNQKQSVISKSLQDKVNGMKKSVQEEGQVRQEAYDGIQIQQQASAPPDFTDN